MGDEEIRIRLLNNLNESKRKLREVEKMVDEGEYCTEVIKRVRELQSSLDRVNQIILERHLHTCLREAIRQGNEERIFTEILEILKYRPD